MEFTAKCGSSTPPRFRRPRAIDRLDDVDGKYLDLARDVDVGVDERSGDERSHTSRSRARGMDVRGGEKNKMSEARAKIREKRVDRDVGVVEYERWR